MPTLSPPDADSRPRASTLLVPPLDGLRFPLPLRNALVAAGLTTRALLAERSAADIGTVRRIGARGLAAIRDELARFGLTFRPEPPRVPGAPNARRRLARF